LGKVLLIVGTVIGGLILGFGLLALLGTVTDNTLSSRDFNDQVLGSILFMVIGATFFAPCLFFLIRSGSRNTLSLMAQGMPYGTGVAGLPTAPADLSSSYIQWFGWCQREIGGNAIALHAATLAAMTAASAGDSGGAAGVARRAAARVSSLASAQSQGTKTPASKIRQLSRIGAATLPLLETGENVVVSLYGTDSSSLIWRLLFGWIGMLISMGQGGAYYVTVTDRRVIALTGPQLTKMPTALAFAVPRSMV
jgi:hypothetical protein